MASKCFDGIVSQSIHGEQVENVSVQKSRSLFQMERCKIYDLLKSKKIKSVFDHELAPLLCFHLFVDLLNWGKKADQPKLPTGGNKATEPTHDEFNVKYTLLHITHFS